jgi:hypothetical protein
MGLANTDSVPIGEISFTVNSPQSGWVASKITSAFSTIIFSEIVVFFVIPSVLPSGIGCHHILSITFCKPEVTETSFPTGVQLTAACTAAAASIAPKPYS